MKEILHIYSRVSSAIQLEGTSIQVQTSIGVELASKLGMDYKLHNEGGKSSAKDTLANRPVMNNLLKQMDHGIVKHLYAFNTDRISRNQTTWFLIRQKMVKNSVKLYTPKGVHDTQDGLENMVLGILSEISQYDNSLRSQRSRLGKLEKVKQNYWRGGLPTFGYTLESDGTANKLVKHPVESKWVNHIFTQYVNGVSLVDVKQELESNNIPTRRGNPNWSLGSLQTIIRNKNYIGIDTYTDGKTGEKITNVIPALISIELYEKATQVRSGKLSKRRQFNKMKHSYLLRDFLTCGGCSTPMTGRIKKVNDEQFYYCPLPERKFNSSKKATQTCPVKKSMDINSADEEVWNLIVKVLSDTETLKSKMYDYNLLGDGANA
ncbi:recombinase family protein, partial [Candidatus Kapabacteria bacterium]|nr:recombinase family protein [Candidatus Kapabacteria bacterium]